MTSSGIRWRRATVTNVWRNMCAWKANQRPAAPLATRIRAQLLVERGDLHVERVDHGQRDRDLLARARQPPPPLARHQIPPLREPVVIEHRLDPLLPLAS